MPVTQPATIHYPVSILDVGDSFFVPAIGSSEHIKQMRKIAASMGYTLEFRTGIDTATGLYGIRVFRVT